MLKRLGAPVFAFKGVVEVGGGDLLLARVDGQSRGRWEGKEAVSK